MYVVTVQFEVDPQHVRAFRAEMVQQATNSLACEEACRQFDVCFDQENEAKCFLYERYDDRAAFDLHLASEHFKQFEGKVTPWLKAKTVEVWKQEEL